MTNHLLYKISSSESVPKVGSFHLHHPDACSRAIRYYVPEVLREYAKQFPARVAAFLSGTQPDRFNEDALDGEIRSFQRSAQIALQQQRHRNLDTLTCIKQRMESELSIVNAKIDQIDRQLQDLEKGLAKLMTEEETNHG